MSERDKMAFEAMLDALLHITEYTQQLGSADLFFEDRKTYDAALMNFIILGESVSRLSAATIENYPDIDFPRIKAFRNLIAHDYFGVNADIVWQIIQYEVPLLSDEIRKLLENS